MLFELYYLGKTYQIRGSSDLLQDVVLGFNISKENLIEVLKLIKKYEEEYLFEDLCNILQGKCLEGIQFFSSLKEFSPNNIHILGLLNSLSKYHSENQVSANKFGGIFSPEISLQCNVK